MNVYLIRHGESVANEERRYSGSQDVSLSRKGIEELELIKSEYDSIQHLSVFVSSLKRTHQTRDVLFPNSKFTDKLAFMSEVNFGDFEGRTYDELKEDIHYQKWVSNMIENDPPNGESYIHFQERVLPNFVSHFSTQVEDVVYITHGGVIRLIMSQLVDPTIPFFEWDIPNGKGYKLQIKKNQIISYQVL